MLRTNICTAHLIFKSLMSLDPCNNFARQASKLALAVGSFDRGRWFSGGGGGRDWSKPTQLAWSCTHPLFFSHVASLYPGRLGQLADSVFVLWLVPRSQTSVLCCSWTNSHFYTTLLLVHLLHIYLQNIYLWVVFLRCLSCIRMGMAQEITSRVTICKSVNPLWLFFMFIIFIFFTPWKSSLVLSFHKSRNVVLKTHQN